MSPTIRLTCTHCKRETYFDQDELSPEAVVSISSRPCPHCGKWGVVIALNVEPTQGVEPPKLSPSALG